MLLQKECLKCKSTNLVLINEEKLAETAFQPTLMKYLTKCGNVEVNINFVVK